MTPRTSSRATVTSASKQKATVKKESKSQKSDGETRLSRLSAGLPKLAEKPLRLATPKALTAMATTARLAKRAPPGLALASGNRVTTMAKYYDRIGQDAERERQRQLVLRGRRARPIMIPRASANVFISTKDALKDDSDDSSSDGADDELDADEDEDGEKSGIHLTAAQSTIKQKTSPTEELLRPLAPLNTPSVTLTASTTLSDVSAPLTGANNKIETNTADTDSAPSGPASPVLSGGSSNRARRPASIMSESEMSSTGTESRSLMKTISSFLTYKGADWPQLEYSL